MPIRTLVIEDVPALLEMAGLEDGFVVSEEVRGFWSRQQLEAWISTGDDVLLGAEYGGKLVGFVLTAFHRPTRKVTWENMLVLPDFRRKGVGEELITQMRASLKEKHGEVYLHFLVKTKNAAGVEYFTNRGFNAGHEFVWFDA